MTDLAGVMRGIPSQGASLEMPNFILQLREPTVRGVRQGKDVSGFLIFKSVFSDFREQNGMD